MYDRVGEVRRLLNERDFIGVFDPDTNVDEYDCMTSPLLAKLAVGASSSEIQRYLDDEIRGHFGMSPASCGTGPTDGRRQHDHHGTTRQRRRHGFDAPTSR